MTHPVLRVLAGHEVWPPPMWLMRQAGRYLPEYRKIRAEAGDFIALCTAPKLAAEVTLQPIRRYGFDAAILFSDILILPWALGYGLQFKEGEGPVLPRLEDEAGLATLDPGRVAGAVEPIMETVRRCREGLGPETVLIGFAGGPFTVACYMVEGGGSKEHARVRTMAQARPELMDRLIGVLTESTIEYLSAQADAGAQVLKVFDSWAGVLSPRLFERYVTAPTTRIVQALKQRHPDIPIIGFPRLSGLGAGHYAQAAGLQGVAFDTGADLTVALDLVPAGIATQGNLDPMALVAGGAALEAETRAILKAVHGKPHIFNLGHGIVPQTPPEHVAQLVHHVRTA
ncbi:MAG: uroporphyrinogen decarboxylase [Alphaproteobacteria bacterium]|nr:MAG: uroporphyrinogen decarboxylase [Alphaproteobacteria bacterium]